VAVMLSHHVDPEEGYCIERMYGLIFGEPNSGGAVH
jgi:hypothetical protein